MSTVSVLAAREYTTRLRSKGFIIGTVLGLLGILGLSFVPFIGSLLSGAFETSIALVVPDAAVSKALQDALAQNHRVVVEPYLSHGPQLNGQLRAQVLKGKYDAALVAYRDRSGTLAFAYYPAKSASLEDQEALKRELLQPVIASSFRGARAQIAERAINFPFATTDLNQRYRSAQEAGLAQALVYFLLVLLYIAVIMYGVYVAQGVIEEKSNRIMEIMIATVRPGQLLAGKVLGIGALALTQMLIFAIAAGTMLMLVAINLAGRVASGGAAGAGASGVTAIATVPPATLLYMLLFFLLGFFSYATMFAGVGALASKAEDLQQSNGILVFPILVAYFLSIFALQDPDKPLFVWASLVPLISPMLMFTRVATSTVPYWQVGISIAASLVAIWAFTLLAAKLYRVGVLMYGKPLAPKEIWRALRAPT